VTAGEQLLFASQRKEENSAFHHKATLEVYGRKWRMEFDSPPEAIAAPRIRGFENMLALGLIASLLLYGMVFTLARTEDRAKVIAMRLTENYRRSEQRFRSSMVHSAIGKALLDSEGRIVEANPALGRIVGRTRESLVGQPFESLFEDEEQSLLPRDDGKVDDKGVRRATRLLRREGELPRQAQLTYAPVAGNVGQRPARRGFVFRLLAPGDVADTVSGALAPGDVSLSLGFVCAKGPIGQLPEGSWIAGIRLPNWFLLAVLAVLPARWAALRRGRWRRAELAARGRCPSCGYDLRATPERCPECGEVRANAECSMKIAG
jgi:PAS domain S-box-containing protein